MITLYDANGHGLVKREAQTELTAATVWIDLFNPTEAEETSIERTLTLDVPTRAEMREIEASNRFYSEDGSQFMTAFIVYGVDVEHIMTSNITFILTGDRLITVRYGEPKAFSIFAERACKGHEICPSGPYVTIGLLETLIQRQADLIEKLQDGVETLAPRVFSPSDEDRDDNHRLENLMRKIGRQGDIASRTQESATSLHRTLLYFSDVVRQKGEDQRLVSRIDSADRDLVSLAEQLRFVSTRTSFLLEATLGMIQTEQNQIIKLFSVMAVMLMPPTLVASIYGMNFDNMPEIHWTYGYPMALGMMIVSGLIPFLYFKHKGWF